jgi:hypothetical protein
MQHQQNAPGRARSLDELVAALDRRVPEIEPGARQENAREVSELRAEASLRITELRTAARNGQEEELARSGSVMTDDGGPAPKE